MNEQPKNERLESDAEGRDVVGLRPGEHYDPVGAMRKLLREIKAEKAAERGEPVPADSDELPSDEDSPA